MRELNPQQMNEVKGGSKCGWLGAITVMSCVTAQMWACGIGVSGFFSICID